MPIDQALLEILVCPETKQKLHYADRALIERLNALREQNKLVNRGGEPVKDAFSEGLVREDGAYLYPIVDDIPVMLIESAIPLSAK